MLPKSILSALLYLKITFEAVHVICNTALETVLVSFGSIHIVCNQGGWGLWECLWLYIFIWDDFYPIFITEGGKKYDYIICERSLCITALEAVHVSFASLHWRQSMCPLHHCIIALEAVHVSFASLHWRQFMCPLHHWIGGSSCVLCIIDL